MPPTMTEAEIAQSLVTAGLVYRESTIGKFWVFLCVPDGIFIEATAEAFAKVFAHIAALGQSVPWLDYVCRRNELAGVVIAFWPSDGDTSSISFRLDWITLADWRKRL